MSSRFDLERDGVRLAGVDFGGAGQPALLLHGLAGYAGEWAETASWLTERCRVVALDARGHGSSERRPADVSQAAHAADAAFVLEHLGLGPAVVVGQSLGGQAAIVLTAERPELVRALVVAGASPAAGDESTLEDVMSDLSSWPVPFESHEAAVSFFGGPSLRAEAWAGGLEQRDDAWWPAFDLEVIARTLNDGLSRDYWSEWERIACPTLVVLAANGEVPESEEQVMKESGPQTTFVRIESASHDLHLERPREWRRALTDFLTPSTDSSDGREEGAMRP